MRTRIIVTLGPSSSSLDVLRGFIKEGVRVFRINYSHGDTGVWKNYIERLRNLEYETGVPLTIIGDLPGPQVRIGYVEPFSVRKGEVLKIVYGEKADKGEIPVPVYEFFEQIDVGDTILLDDGRLQLHVEDVMGNSATAIALSDGRIMPHKTILIKGKELELPTLSERDMEAISFSIENGVDYIALSYIRAPRDIETLRTVIANYGAEPGIIAKIETRSAVENLEQITELSDAVLVARGDLGMFYGLEKIPFLQKHIVSYALEKGKPVIIATQLLESMINNPQPTRSEVVDIVEAVNEHVDALLLTSETAIGRYPIEAVRWLRKIITTAEKKQEENKQGVIRVSTGNSIRERYALGVVLLCESLGTKIVIYTRTGFMPSLISRFRPVVNVYAGSGDIRVVRRLNLYYGVEPIHVGGAKDDYEHGLNMLYEELRKTGKIKLGDLVALIYGKRGKNQHLIKITEVL